MSKGKTEMLTPRKFAELRGVAYPTVIKWIGQDLLPGVQKEPLPFGEGKYVYKIPSDVPIPQDRKPGPVPKKAAVVPESKPATKKRASKKAGN